MTRLRTFSHGGIAILQRTHFESSAVQNAFLPIHALVMLKERESASDPVLLVSEGQEVREGQLLARQSGHGSANVHAPIPGLIHKVTRVRSPAGFMSDAIVLSLHGSFSIAGKKPERYLWRSLNKHDILYILLEKGIVRTTTGESVYELLNTAGNGSACIVNCLDTDPYSHCEEEVLYRNMHAILDGCLIIQKVTGAEKIIFAIPSDMNTDRIDLLKSIAAEVKLPVIVEKFIRKYPQDFPGRLKQSLSSKNSKLKSAIILEPTTLSALHDAVTGNKAQIEQYVYLGGGALKKSSILKARIGTSIGDLLEECGGFVGTPYSLVINSPYNGNAVADPDTPISKTTKAILALTRSEVKPSLTRSCIRCGDCIKICPEQLNPYLMNKLISNAMMEEVFKAGIDRCTLCGSCSYICPSHIALGVNFKNAKTTRKNHE